MTVKQVIERFVGMNATIYGDFIIPEVPFAKSNVMVPQRDHQIQGVGDEVFWATRGGNVPGTVYIPYSSVSCVLEYQRLPASKKEARLMGDQALPTYLAIYLMTDTPEHAKRVRTT